MNKHMTDMDKLTTWRNILNKVCLIAVILSIAGIFDGLYASYQKPETRIDLVQGSSTEIIGRFYGMTQGLSDLSVVSSTKDLDLTFDPDAFRGFWLGEDMWRATITAKPGMGKGSHILKIIYSDLSNIKAKNLAAVDKLSTYHVNTYPDALSLRQNEISWVKRILGISPWWLFVFFFPGVILCSACVFYVSGLMDAHLVADGKAEIYRVSKKANGLEIFFGLGEKHGLVKDEWLMLFSDQGQGVARFQIETLGKENSSAQIGFIEGIGPGCLVSRING